MPAAAGAGAGADTIAVIYYRERGCVTQKKDGEGERERERERELGDDTDYTRDIKTVVRQKIQIFWRVLLRPFLALRGGEGGGGGGGGEDVHLFDTAVCQRAWRQKKERRKKARESAMGVRIELCVYMYVRIYQKEEKC